jgi:uncharacterized protein YdhG (YjbR/CyaY superfamily)
MGLRLTKGHEDSLVAHALLRAAPRLVSASGGHRDESRCSTQECVRHEASSTESVLVMNSKVPKDIDEYLAGVPEPGRTTLSKVRAVIRSAVPAEATEAISYGIPTFKYKGSLVAFAAFKNHCSLFPMSKAVIETFKNELKGFHASKGTLHFPLDKPLPAALLKKMVKMRIVQNEERKRSRRP